MTAGSQLSAGIAPATLKLYQGGQVLICPRSRLSINSDNRGLMLGMDAGSLEIALQVNPGSTDFVFTPDMSVRLAGPGTYHFALGVTGQGNTCYKPLPGNAAGIVVSELMGSEEYGIAADQAASFPGGKVSARTALAGECGCPLPSPTLRAEATAEATPNAAPEKNARAPASSLSGSDAGSVHESEKASSQVTVETPFVFSANAPPAPARVQYSLLPNVFLAQEDVNPVVLKEKEASNPQPVATPAAAIADNSGKKEKKGFLARFKGFFTGLFHR